MADPYQTGVLPENIYYKKVAVQGKMVVIMDGEIEDRRLHLIMQPTRAVRKHEIVELITTEENPSLGGIVNAIGYLGFVEVERGGVIKRGDTISIADRCLGEVVGFDETHLPNHMNLIIKVKQRVTGKGINVNLGEEVQFIFPRCE